MSSRKARWFKSKTYIGLSTLLLSSALVLYLLLPPALDPEAENVPETPKLSKNQYSEDAIQRITDALNQVTDPLYGKLDEGQQVRLALARMRLLLDHPDFKARAEAIRRHANKTVHQGVLYVAGGADKLSNVFISLRVIREVCWHATWQLSHFCMFFKSPSHATPCKAGYMLQNQPCTFTCFACLYLHCYNIHSGFMLHARMMQACWHAMQAHHGTSLWPHSFCMLHATSSPLTTLCVMGDHHP